MIIKSKSYKTTKSFNTVLHYIFRENERNNGFELTKFIKGKNLFPDELSSQFRFNEQFRINKRKNSVLLFMDILSFHPRDAERLTNDKLHQIALKYLSLRAPKSIAVATVHRNEKYHTHLHLVFSGIEYKTGKSIRMSKEDFQNKVKIPMEKYQQEVFPELMLSKINHEKLRFLQKEQKKDSEIIMEFEGEISEKQKILKLLEEIFKTATCEKYFYQKLEAKELKLYTRNGKITGIEGNRKFRFSRLGYTPELLQSLEQNPTQNQRLELLQNIREKSQEKERKW